MNQENQKKASLFTQPFKLHQDFAGGVFDINKGRIGLNIQPQSPLKINHNIGKLLLFFNLYIYYIYLLYLKILLNIIIIINYHFMKI